MTSTLSFKVALIKLLIVSLFSISILKANPPLLVNDTQANATATITASRMADFIKER